MNKQIEGKEQDGTQHQRRRSKGRPGEMKDRITAFSRICGLSCIYLRLIQNRTVLAGILPGSG